MRPTVRPYDHDRVLFCCSQPFCWARPRQVVTARNPVHGVLFLILAFFNAAGLFLIAGAEFLAMILVIVYVGAVAVLFMFVVMMLDVDFCAVARRVQRYAPMGAVVGVDAAGGMVLVLFGWQVSPRRGGFARLGDPAWT